MTTQEKSIALICNDVGQSGEILNALRGIPLVRVEEQSATLSEINGHALHLASSHDMVIFRTDSAGENDISAIQVIREQTDGNAILLALTDENTTLSFAHKLMAAGVNEVLPDTISAEDLQKQIDRWIFSKPADVGPQTGAAGGRIGKVIAVAQARGGVGATTLAVNLADCLLNRKGLTKKIAENRVVLVDLDIQFGTIASHLDLPASDVFEQMAQNNIMPDDTYMRQSLARLPSGLSVLTAPDGFIPMDALRRDQITRVIELLRQNFDYVVIDMPRTLVDWVGGVAEMADRVFMVTDSTVPAIRNASRLIKFYTEDCLDLQIDVIVNYEKRPLLLRSHHNEAARALDRPLLGWLPLDPKAAREASDRGVPLSEAAGRSALAKAIKRLGRTTLKTLISQATTAAAQ